jgi:hypothetical protein
MPYRDVEDVRAYARERQRKARARNKQYLKELRTNAPCVDCGQTFHWSAMQFDHVRGIKFKQLSHLAREGRTLRVIQDELKKTELVCANCHAVRTWRRAKEKRQCNS